MSARRAAAQGGLAGAATALAFWARDLASLRELHFAGVADSEVQSRVLDATQAAVLGLELRLVALHLLMGALLGAAAALAAGASRGRAARIACAAAFVAAVQALAVLGMMARYPQLYADAWWVAGGWRAAVQRFATHVAGARVLDGLLIAVVLPVAAGLVLRVLRAAAARARGVRLDRRAAAAAVVALLAGMLAAAAGSARRAPLAAPADARPNVLLLVVDSLRGDRLESSEVMPAGSAALARGTLFRHAFTPVARTFPSWVSLLTGREPRHTGVRTMFPDLASRRDPGPTFVSELRDRGYRTFVASDFAGDVFPRFPGGFDAQDAPTLTADRLARATVLAAHGASLPLLRVPALRSRLEEWRNLASLSDPQWLADLALHHARQALGRPFAGVVFFSTAHFPYVAPWPDYLRGRPGYRGPFLYHAPPVSGERATGPEDVAQVRALYDGALRSVDRAIGRVLDTLRADGSLARTIVVVTADHGEELYEQAGIAGHGDTLGERSQAVPILLLGPGIDAGRRRDDQVRLVDLGATLLGLVEGRRGLAFGDGVDLLVEGLERPACVETGIWFWPRLPLGLQGRRLEYPGIAELLELDPGSRELVLKPQHVARVESAKVRGIVLGSRLRTEQITPSGPAVEERRLPGIRDDAAPRDLAGLFEERCVAGDPALARFLGAVVWARPERSTAAP